MNLDNNAHSVFILHYHLVLVVKYRRKFLMMIDQTRREKFLSILLRVTTLPSKKGITIKTMYTYCSRHTQTHR